MSLNISILYISICFIDSIYIRIVFNISIDISLCISSLLFPYKFILYSSNMYSKFSFITVNGGLTISFIVNIFLVSSLFSSVLSNINKLYASYKGSCASP